MTPPFRLTPDQTAGLKLLGGPQRHTLLVGGARSGKTFLLVRAVVMRALRAPFSRHAILRYRANAVWAAVGMDTMPKVLRLCFPQLRVSVNKQDRYFTLPNGAEIWLSGLDDKERVEKILGQEYATIYFNEASQIPHSSYVVAQTRLAQVVNDSLTGRPLLQREYVDLNPSGTGHWTYRQFIQKIDQTTRKPLAGPDDYRHAFLNPGGNAENLSPEFLASLATLPEKQRKRFFEGQYVAEVEGALWPLDLIASCRVDSDDAPVDMQRVVVSIDPSGTSGADDKRSDAVGIVVAGLGIDGRGYVLEDLTCKLPPSGWAERAITAYYKHFADLIIAERNYGGAMVQHVIKTTDGNVNYKEVVASRGKAVRAEPIANLFSQGKVSLVGRFPDLEDQMGNFSTMGYQGDGSPDRVDAMVWALTELLDSTGRRPLTFA